MSDTPKDPAENFLHLKEELEQCIRCGECRTVCPVFDATLHEKFVARGKISLLVAAAEGKLELSDSFYKGLSNCLLCKACVDNCANNVSTDKLIIKAREIYTSQKGLPILQRIIYTGLANAGSATKSLKAAHTMQKAVFRKIPETSGMRRRFPLPLIDSGQLVPELAEIPFREAHPPIRSSSGAQEKVIFFTGCMSNYAYTSIAEAVVKVLNALGKEVITPEQTCCGAPMYLSGDVETAKKLAETNMELLGQYTGSKIVLACPTCGMMLKQHLLEIISDDYIQTATSIAARTMDISEYLYHSVGVEEIRQHIVRPIAATTTYHDPCHLNRGQGISHEPRELLKLACGTGFSETEDADRCCGLAGTYSIVHRETSQKIQQKKSQKLKQNGADLIVTGCPGCIMQLQDGAGRIGSQSYATHTIEVLARAMGIL